VGYELCNTDRQARLVSFRKTVQQLMAFLLYALCIAFYNFDAIEDDTIIVQT